MNMKSGAIYDDFTSDDMMVWNYLEGNLGCKQETVSVIYENNDIIGWCTTCQEADDICDKLHHLQWGYKKKSKIPEATPHLVASVMLEENKNKNKKGSWQ